MKKFKLPKKDWKYGKSKFRELRPELQNKVEFSVSDEFKEEERKIINANRLRRLNKYGN